MTTVTLEQDEYQEYIKNSVLLAEKRLDEQGSDKLTKEQIKAHVLKNIKNKLNSNG